jgi:outer membrane biosynthesis protein TonB
MLTMMTGRFWAGRYPAVLLLLLSAGCASATPPQPQVAATQPAAAEPATPQPAATPQAPAVAAATPKPVPSQPVASEPAAKPVTTPAARKDAAPVKATPKPVAPAVAASPAAPAPTAAPTLDLNALTARLKATKAIGVFTKISLKNKVDDLMQRFAEHYQGKKPPIAELRLSYDLLMMKVLSLLQNDDQALASAVASSREAIWALLADEKKFAALQS